MPAFRALPYAVCILALAGVGACSSSDAGTGPGGATQVSSTGAVKRLEVTIAGTTVTPPPAQVDLPVGSTLELVVTSDHADELHAHGFDVEARLEAGKPTTLRLTGTEAGVYEVETHEPALTLLTVAVR
jgi:heme/copper-type cytochrome/quinol oxidase subunit 2